jgi:RNA polymerase sigma factor (sigma-70 family)
MDDAQLLQEYVERRSERAFAELVGRHVNLVYSTALRMVRDTTLAEDVTQTVFIQLARKASSIRSGNALTGWLYRVTHGHAVNAMRDERSRRQHETEAVNMAQSDNPTSTAWESIALHLEEAMDALTEQDQNAVLHRFFQDRSWREVGAILALSEDGAQKRVSRALDKLRQHLARRGVVASASVLGMAITGNAVQAAPAGLASIVTAASLAGATGVGSFSFSTLIKTILMKKTTYAILSTVIVAAVSIPFIVAKVGSTDAPITTASLNKGLVMHLTFDRDETGDNEVTDTSGQGNYGKASGVHWTADGKKGGAYEFTADGDQIEIENNKSLNPKQLTLAAWIKTTTKDDVWRRIFDKSYNKGFALSIAADWQGNKWSSLASLELGPGTHFSLTKTVVADGQWHQIVATFDGTKQLLFVDGKQECKPLLWKKTDKLGATDFNLVIGCNRSNLKEDDLGKSFRGLIDEPMMWDRALSPKEVAFLYQSQQ